MPRLVRITSRDAAIAASPSFSEEDRILYLDLLRRGRAAAGECLAWGLMDNHAHPTLIPATAAGPRAAVTQAPARRHENAAGPQRPTACSFAGKPNRS